MKASANRGLRTPFKVTAVFVACLAAGLSACVLLGHRILTAAHSVKDLPFIGRMAVDHSISGGQCLASADQQVILLVVPTFLSPPFCLLFVPVVRSLLRRDADSPCIKSAQSGVRPWEVAGAFLVYSLPMIACFPNVVLNLGSQLVGLPGDNMQHRRDIRWARTALTARFILSGIAALGLGNDEQRSD